MIFGNGSEDTRFASIAHFLILSSKDAGHLLVRTEDVDAMSHFLIYFMKNVGEELTTARMSAGLEKITSRGLSVFVKNEEIKLKNGEWVNATNSYNNLEDAVKDALRRHEGS